MATQQADSSYERLAAHHKLKLPDAVAQSIGFMGPVFSIAFLVPLLVGVNAASQGAGGAAPLAVLVAAIGILGLGWIVSEYAKRIHAAGSLYDYVTDGLGSRVGAAAGWLYYSGIIVLGGSILVLISGYIHDTLQAEFNVTPLPVGGWMIVLLVLISAILYAGVQLSTRAQLVLAMISLTLLTIFFIYVIAKVGSGNSAKAFNPSSSPTHLSGVLFGVLYGVLLFVGFETAANLAEETEHPKRDIPRAVIFAVIAATVFYLIGSYAQVAGFHFDLGKIAKAASAPLFALAGPSSAGGYGSVAIRRLVELLVLFDMLAVLIGISVSGPRGLFAMARDRRLPGVPGPSAQARHPGGRQHLRGGRLRRLRPAHRDLDGPVRAARHAPLLGDVLLGLHVRQLRAGPDLPAPGGRSDQRAPRPPAALGRHARRHRQPARDRRRHLRLHLQGEPPHRTRPVRGDRMVHRGPRGRPDCARTAPGQSRRPRSRRITGVGARAPGKLLTCRRHSWK